MPQAGGLVKYPKNGSCFQFWPLSNVVRIFSSSLTKFILLT